MGWYRDISRVEFPKIRGTVLWVPRDQIDDLLGVYIGGPRYLGKLPFAYAFVALRVQVPNNHIPQPVLESVLTNPKP